MYSCLITDLNKKQYE
uniref:Uncharacterized protein n=1 Tax=Arundo donax TaxID=35708 RepID=A0A0A9A0Z2_ARUDO